MSTRIRYMFNLQQLVQKNQDEIARCIVKEQGKTFADAKVNYTMRAVISNPSAQGDVFRGLEVIEHSCSVGSLAMGETIENVSKNIDTYSYRQPLGVAAGVAPFNFPAMIPMYAPTLFVAPPPSSSVTFHQVDVPYGHHMRQHFPAQAL